VSAGDLPDWPDVLKDCAEAAGAPLPPLKPQGNPIDWGEMRNANGFLIKDAADEKLDERGAGLLHFHSITEPPEIAIGDPHTIQVRLQATIQRPDAKALLQTLQQNLFGQIPATVRPFVAQALQPIINGLIGRVSAFLDAHGEGYLWLTYHTFHQTPSPEPTPTQPGTGWVHYDRAESPGVMAGRIWDLVACDGLDGPWSGTFMAGGIQANGEVIVPFGDIPISFTPENGGANLQVGRRLPYPPSGGLVDIKVRYKLHFAINGTTMTITGKGSSAGPGGVVNVGGVDVPRLDLPIEPAPSGAC
jgi:hypothetical protein